MFYSILKCFVEKKDIIYIYSKNFENKMFMKIDMRSYVGCKILQKATFNEEKNKGIFFNLVFFIDEMNFKNSKMLLTCITNNIFLIFH